MGTGSAASRLRERSSEVDDLPVPIQLQREGAAEKLHPIARKLLTRGVFWHCVGARGLCRSSGHHLAFMTCHLSVQHPSSLNSQSLFDLMPRALRQVLVACVTRGPRSTLPVYSASSTYREERQVHLALSFSFSITVFAPSLYSLLFCS